MIQQIETTHRQTTQDHWELRKLGSVLRRRWLLLIAVTAVITSGVAYKIWLQKPIYRQQFQLFLDINTGEELSPLSENARTPAFVPLQFRDFKTEMEVLTSYQVISPLLPAIQSRYSDLDYDKLIKNLKLKHQENTALIGVSYEDDNPEKVKFVLEKLAQSYTTYSLNKLQTSTNQAIKLVDDRLPQLKNRVDQLQGQLQQFRRQYNLVDIEQQSKILSDRMGSIIQQKQEAQALMGETRSQAENLQQQLGIDIKQAMAISALSEAPRYLALAEELQKLDSQISSESVRLTEGHPAIIALREKRQRLLPLIEQEVAGVAGSQVGKLDRLPTVSSPDTIRLELTQKLIETGSQLTGIQTRLQSLTASENQARQSLQQFAMVVRRYTDLNRNLEIASQV
ncbi:MAG: hypothetical protein HC785_04550 [Calothrix sp. CSU_2_0]|nr:hypothetical protein [Calothrix sp. CSU_2_0]